MSKKMSTQEKARRLWVRALRSGKYGWGKSFLHPAENEYCCLGVLCEIAIKHGIIGQYNRSKGSLSSYPKVMKWVGLVDDNGLFGDDSLTSKNDVSKTNPFKRIASLIEKKPKGLFVEDSK